LGNFRMQKPGNSVNFHGNEAIEFGVSLHVTYRALRSRLRTRDSGILAGSRNRKDDLDNIALPRFSGNTSTVWPSPSPRMPPLSIPDLLEHCQPRVNPRQEFIRDRSLKVHSNHLMLWFGNEAAGIGRASILHLAYIRAGKLLRSIPTM
jgi:hypothetical protein